MKKVPSFHTETNELTGTVVFTVLFAIVFLNIYIPTSDTAWFDLGRSIFFFMSLGFITMAAGILVLSRTIMFKTRLIITMTYAKYIAWILAEVLLITLFYTVVTFHIIDPDPDNYWLIFRKAIVVVSTVLLVPYAATYIYCTVNDKRKTLQLIQYNDATDEAPKEGIYDHELIHLSDNNGNVKLSVKLENLYYIESQDNYIKIYYLSNNEMKHYMLRCKLKTIEDSFANSSLSRCHRSYIVNKNKVRVIRKEKEGTYIDMDWDGIAPIPISKSYLSTFMENTLN